MNLLLHALILAGSVAAALLIAAGLLHLTPKLGPSGRKLASALCRAPFLDWIVTYFTVVPLFVGPILLGWLGLAAAIVGQVAAVMIWTFCHELANRDAVRGPRIDKVLNRIVGRWRNHAALWVTAIVTPMFWIVRMAEIFLYPALVRLVGFPKYDSAEWVNVSRQKFTGLVGHDLIWCLYCDWMTGIWSLGSEMLRNVESFWCPIRYLSDKKCDNCQIDFPDLENGWVAANGSMTDVTNVLEQMHSNGHRGWFGHPTRLTVKGEIPKA